MYIYLYFQSKNTLSVLNSEPPVLNLDPIQICSIFNSTPPGGRGGGQFSNWVNYFNSWLHPFVCKFREEGRI